MAVLLPAREGSRNHAACRMPGCGRCAGPRIRTSGGPEMRIVKIEDLHADGGWRVTSFVKLTTDEGLVGWSEYYDGFGAGGLSDLIRRYAEIVTGMDPRDVGRISATLHAISRM